VKSELACEVAKKLLDSGEFHVLKFVQDDSNAFGEAWNILLHGCYLDSRQFRAVERIVSGHPSLRWAIRDSRVVIYEDRDMISVP